MSFLDHLVDCNRHDMENFLPLTHRDQRVGWVKRNLVAYFSSFPNAVRCDSTKIETNPALNTPDLLTGSMAEVGVTLTAAGLTKPWRNEPYAVGTRFGECLFELERAVIPAFGVRGYGLHLTGFVRKGGQISIWVPRRTADRPTYPPAVARIQGKSCSASGLTGLRGRRDRTSWFRGKHRQRPSRSSGCN